MRPKYIVSFLLLLAFTAIASADLASVRYERSGRGHHYLSTHSAIPVGDREVSISVFLFADRYVALYSESKRISGNQSEVLVQRELAGRVSGTTLEGLGSARVLAEQKNGKPVVELVLSQAIDNAPRGLTAKLGWTYGSWAPKSVTGQ
jgi:hypothetical protein